MYYATGCVWFRFAGNMMRVVLILPILVCLLTHAATAQVLRGKVTEAGAPTGLYPVTVVNMRTQDATYTTSQGEYSIAAEVGDKIAFSFIGYKTLQHQVTAFTANIAMERVSYRLKELVFTPGGYTPYQIDSIERRRTYRPFLARQKSRILASPVSFVAEKFNKRSKQIFKFQKKFVQWEDERYIDTRYTPELVYDMTGLEGDSLGHFMNNFPMPYDYARTATDLEMQMWIRTHYRDWLKMIDTTGIQVMPDTLFKKP